MNTVRTDEIDNDCFNNTEAPDGDQKLLILACSNNMHLIWLIPRVLSFCWLQDENTRL